MGQCLYTINTIRFNEMNLRMTRCILHKCWKTMCSQKDKLINSDIDTSTHAHVFVFFIFYPSLCVSEHSNSSFLYIYEHVMVHGVLLLFECSLFTLTPLFLIITVIY